MPETVFFSWQADRPNNNGRNFIERCLERALARINGQAHVEEAVRDDLVVDSDTRNVPGQPPIVDTIFKKIDEATAFVPDMTFVGTRLDGRPSPNPNVLIEYGWALKSLGHSRIVPIMNVAHGAATSDSMPFDMKHLRYPIAYNLTDDASADEKRIERDKLVKKLELQLSTIIESEGLRSQSMTATVRQRFVRAEPLAGPSRFRSPGSSIGIARGSFERPSEVFLRDGPAFWLRVMPRFAQSRTWSTVELQKAAGEHGSRLIQLVGGSGWSKLRADDGFGNFEASSDEPKTGSITFAFESGEVWAIDAKTIARIMTHAGKDSQPGFPLIENELRDAVASYSLFLEQLGIGRPYDWIAGVTGIKGFGIYYPPPPRHFFIEQGPKGVCVAETIIDEGAIEAGDDPKESIKPFFEKLFAKFGIERPTYLDAIGEV